MISASQKPKENHLHSISEIHVCLLYSLHKHSLSLGAHENVCSMITGRLICDGNWRNVTPRINISYWIFSRVLEPLLFCFSLAIMIHGRELIDFLCLLLRQLKGKIDEFNAHINFDWMEINRTEKVFGLVRINVIRLIHFNLSKKKTLLWIKRNKNYEKAIVSPFYNWWSWVKMMIDISREVFSIGKSNLLNGLKSANFLFGFCFCFDDGNEGKRK